jgi:hypothetical protein
MKGSAFMVNVRWAVLYLRVETSRFDIGIKRSIATADDDMDESYLSMRS